MNGLQVAGLITVVAYALIWVVSRMGSLCTREEEQILAEELMRKQPQIKPPPNPIHFRTGREIVVLDYSTVTLEEIQSLDRGECYGQSA